MDDNFSDDKANLPAKDFSKRLSIYSLDHLDEKTDDDVRCGYGPCKPNFLQRCNNPKVLLCCIGLFNFAQGYMIQGTMNQATASLERRFGLSSTQVSLINTAYDIYSGVFILPMGMFCVYSHKPRLLGIGALSITFGAFLMILPHILVGKYELGQEKQYPICVPQAVNATDILCKESLRDNQGLYIAIWAIAQAFNAFGGVTLNLLGVATLDENVKMKNLPLYAGVNQVFNNFGPSLAFLVGSRFLAMYVDVGRVDMDDVTLRPRDPAWVGAWWIGFALSGCMLLPSALLLLCFNYETPHARNNARSRISEAHKGKGVKERKEDFAIKLKDIPKGFKLLCTNPIVMITAIIFSLRSGIISGLIVFINKYVQFQFSVTQAKASLVIGGAILPTSIVGMIGGGWFIRRFNLKIKGMIIMNIIVELIGLPLAFTFLLRCNEVPLAGVVKPYFNTTATDSVYSSCNAGCNCNTQRYAPFCGTDELVYFNPCMAGCSGQVRKGEFGPCSCVDNATYFDQVEPVGDPVKVVKGPCDASCGEFFIFIAALVLYLLSNFITGQSGLTSLLRSVPERERTLAVAILWVVARFTGMIPFPIILGVMFDSSCLVWEEKCGKKGSCWVYDGKFLSWGITGWILVVGVAVASLYALALKLYKPPEDEDEKEEVVMANGKGNQDDSPAEQKQNQNNNSDHTRF